MRTPDYVVTYDETPAYLTTGKRYPVEDDLSDAVLLSILDDEGDGIIILSWNCSHLEGNKWKRGYTFHV